MSLNIWTLPNIITMTRIATIPGFLWLLLQDDPRFRLGAIIIFILASISDFLDGYLARKMRQDSKLGRFLDPLADKILVIATLFAFMILDHAIDLWMVIVIFSRDVLITFMRFLAVRKNMEIKTTKLAKAKTAFQMISITLILMILLIRSFQLDIQKTFANGHKMGMSNIQIASGLFGEGLEMLKDVNTKKSSKTAIFAESAPYFLMLLTTIFTVISGLRYLIFNFKVLLPPYKIWSFRE